MIVKKKQRKIIEAYRLGDKGATIRKLMGEGLIVQKGEGVYEIFSQEAVNGTGESATNDYYIRVDSSGKPYPNKPEFIEENHKKVEENLYEQIPKELLAWTIDEEMCEEISFLKDNEKLTINENDEEKYFNAYLWGTHLSAPKDAVIIFYKIKKDDKGKIIEIDFNFVQREEFDKTYDIIE